MLKEFREFALKGSVVDLAVGIIIGGAFGKIVSSLVNDIVMPVLGLIVGKIDLTGLKYDIGLKADGKTLSIMYGSFLQNVIDFLIIAFSIFLMVKLINSFRKKKKEEEKKEEAAKPTAEEVLLTEIRDLLKDGKDK